MSDHATKFQAIKGVRDILPPDSALWNRVEQAAREVFATYGYGEIRLPIFEPTELFERSVGAETDIVNKEMYVFDLHGSSRLAFLRDKALQTDLEPHEAEVTTVAETDLNFGEFVNELNRGISEGRVERTSDKVEAIEELKHLWATFHDIRLDKEGFFPPIDPENWSQEQNRLHERMRKAARGIRFGLPVALRPEATASVVRAYIQHGMQTRPGNVKLYYMGPMFRRERPQKGRYRQFYQIGAELLGPSDHAGLDAEVIEMLLAFFERVQLKGATLYINSIGDKNCRPAYIEKLREELRKVKDRLGPDSQRRIETNPLRVLDSKIPDEQPVIAGLPHIADHLCDECKTNYAQLKHELALRNITYEENWRLVRGLDYYMRTTFEIIAPGLGSQNAVCGGGRYDGLVEMLGGPPTKGIGFAIGTDRLILSLEQAGAAKPSSTIDVYLAWMGMAAYPAAVTLARKLRQQGIAVELPADEMKFGKSLNLADRLGARYAVILGDDELASKQFTVKRLADGEQKKLPESDLISFLQGAKSQS